MDKNENSLSASEINNYIYCPLQWYYTRVYGGRRLRELYRESHPEAQEGNAAFEKGRVFHETYERRERRGRMIKSVVLAIVVLLFLAVLFFVVLFFTEGSLMWQ